MDLCTSIFNGLLADGSRIYLEHRGVTVAIKGWCPRCGSLLLENGHKVAPSELPFRIAEDGVQVIESAASTGVASDCPEAPR